MKKIRCKWANGSEELAHYHDKEYGFIISDDIPYFERLTLEIFQAGLSWATILKKRNAFCKAFDDFDFLKIAFYDEKKVALLLQDKSIIRNRLKITATIYNAQQFINIVKEYGNFNNFIHSLPINNREEILKIFKKRFRFIGPLIVEEFMMSVGLWKVKHEKDCFLFCD
ncbi:MAG: DNA-3-methyladenine glycosylase I [Spirochaetes bacterium]|nr:DNA-3-methyladenine glycosylase I [Spirochaetota bacterium]